MRSIAYRLAALLLAGAAPLGAQSVRDRVAYAVLVETTPAGLPPILSNAMMDLPVTAPEVAARLGHLASGDAAGRLNTFAASLGLPMGRQAMLRLTAGFQNSDCRGIGCDHPVAGVQAEGRIASSAIGTGPDVARLTVGLNGEMGFAHPSGNSLVSLTTGVPIALVAMGSHLRLAPFLTPALGWSRADEGGFSENGTHFLLGGGVAIQGVSSGLGADFGFQKVFVDNGRTTLGVTVVFGFR